MLLTAKERNSVLNPGFWFGRCSNCHITVYQSAEYRNILSGMGTCFMSESPFLRNMFWMSVTICDRLTKSAISFAFVGILTMTGSNLQVVTRRRNSLNNFCISSFLGFKLLIVSTTATLSQWMATLLPLQVDPQTLAWMMTVKNSLQWIGTSGDCISKGNLLDQNCFSSGFHAPAPESVASPSVLQVTVRDNQFYTIENMQE